MAWRSAKAEDEDEDEALNNEEASEYTEDHHRRQLSRCSLAEEEARRHEVVNRRRGRPRIVELGPRGATTVVERAISQASAARSSDSSQLGVSVAVERDIVRPTAEHGPMRQVSP